MINLFIVHPLSIQLNHTYSVRGFSVSTLAPFTTLVGVVNG